MTFFGHVKQKTSVKKYRKTMRVKRIRRWQNIIETVLKNKDKCYLDGGSGSGGLVKWLWELYNNKKWPKGMLACHTCDNGSCLNIFHIFPGTSSDNRKDCISKGRANSVKGEEVYGAVLTKDDVKSIYQMYQSEEFSMRDLAKKFNVSYYTIWAIINRQSWKHIELKEQI